MINPILVRNNLLSNYISYIETGLPLASKYYVTERRKLLCKGTTLMREPYIELVRKYGDDDSVSIEDACREVGFDKEKTTIVSSFLRTGLLGNHKLYKHQKKAFVSFCKDKKNVVVTTGTGSGKTESFLIPLLSNLVIEKTSNVSFAKKAGMRAIILYPLNALAEDQVCRIRQILDSDESRKWIREHCNGNRITFGRYNGKTI